MSHDLGFLEKEKVVVAEIKNYKGNPAIFINGKPEDPTIYAMTPGMMDTQEDRIRGLTKSFSDAGIHLYTFFSYLRDAMPKEGVFDFSKIDSQLSGILSVDPDAKILIRAHLEVPDWWVEKNSEELVGFGNTPFDTNRPWEDAGPTKRASMASEVWKKDMTFALKNYIQHIEKTACGKRVIGYHVANGVYGEWHYWGFDHYPDTGKAMTEKFRKWLREKYSGDISLLQKNWNNKNANFENIEVPTMQERCNPADGFLFDPVVNRNVIDYFECQHDVVSSDFIHFCKLVKEETKNKLAGGFYGYYFYMPYALQTAGGHLNMDKVLDCPYVDFFSSPYSYEDDARKADGDGLFRSVANSIKLHNKMFICEMDSPTLRGDPFQRDLTLWGSETLEGSIRIVQRDFCNIFTHGVGGWWFDHGGGFSETNGWWNEPAFMGPIKQMKEIADANFGVERSSVSEVAVICDLKSFFYVSFVKDKLSFPLLDKVRHALYKSGAAHDVILSTDLDKIDTSKYKVYIFLNTFKISDQQKKIIESKIKAKNHTILWVYAPGYIDTEKLSTENISQITEIQIKKSEKELPGSIEISDAGHSLTKGLPEKHIFGIKDDLDPAFYVDDKDAVTLGLVAGTQLPGFCIKQFKDWTSIYCFAPPTSPALLMSIFKNAGIHIYEENEDIIFASKHILCINSEKGGKRLIKLPQRSEVVNLFNNKTIGKNMSEFSAEFDPKSIHLFLVTF